MIQLLLSSVLAFVVVASVTVGVVKLAKSYLIERRSKRFSASVEDQEAASSDTKRDTTPQTDGIQVHIDTFN